MHAIQNNTISLKSNITFWRSNIFLAKEQRAWIAWRWNTRPLSLTESSSYCKLYQATAWINCKASASTENDQPGKI